MQAFLDLWNRCANKRRVTWNLGGKLSGTVEPSTESSPGCMGPPIEGFLSASHASNIPYLALFQRCPREQRQSAQGSICPREPGTDNDHAKIRAQPGRRGDSTPSAKNNAYWTKRGVTYSEKSVKLFWLRISSNVLVSSNNIIPLLALLLNILPQDFIFSRGEGYGMTRIVRLQVVQDTGAWQRCALVTSRDEGVKHRPFIRS